MRKTSNPPPPNKPENPYIPPAPLLPLPTIHDKLEDFIVEVVRKELKQLLHSADMRKMIRNIVR